MLSDLVLVDCIAAVDCLNLLAAAAAAGNGDGDACTGAIPCTSLPSGCLFTQSSTIHFSYAFLHWRSTCDVQPL